MEPPKKQMRAIWPLFKCRMTNITDTGCQLVIQLPGVSTTIQIAHDMRMCDVRDGDLLTVYTEVLLTQPMGSA